MSCYCATNDCYFKTDGQDCWGPTGVVDAWIDEDVKDEYENYYFMHACEGHSEMCFGRAYKVKPPVVISASKVDDDDDPDEYMKAWGGCGY